jgi:hypothetical protein
LRQKSAKLLIALAVQNCAFQQENSYWPVPDSGTFCGLPPPRSVIDTFADRVPVAVGVKVTLIEQLAPFATLLPQVLVWL